jgi:hypothetical protein
MIDIFEIDLIEEDILDIELVEEDIVLFSIYSEDVFTIDVEFGGYMYENNYNKLINKPSVNGEILIGEKSFEQLGRNNMSSKMIKNIVDDAYDIVFGG